MRACLRGPGPRCSSPATKLLLTIVLMFQCAAWADDGGSGAAKSETVDLRARFNPESTYSEQLPANLDFTGFEVALRESAFGTFVFYDRLTSHNRRKVYDGYRGDRSIAAIGVDTLELLRSQ